MPSARYATPLVRLQPRPGPDAYSRFRVVRRLGNSLRRLVGQELHLPLDAAEVYELRPPSSSRGNSGCKEIKYLFIGLCLWG